MESDNLVLDHLKNKLHTLGNECLISIIMKFTQSNDQGIALAYQYYEEINRSSISLNNEIDCGNDSSTLHESIEDHAKLNKKKIKSPRPFDMTKYRQRQLAFHIQYEGEKYLGLAFQSDDSDQSETIEKYLFDTLLKLKLIESRQTCNYSRCGRTDRGVSAFGQIVSLSVRSAFPKDFPSENMPKHPNDYVTITDFQGKSSKLREIDYITLMNKSLPNTIRVLSWCEVTSEFSARFSCAFRKYRYFFNCHNLDINLMNQAAKLLVGKHDFRNFCKMDIANVSNFEREIYSAEIKPFSQYNCCIGTGNTATNVNDIFVLELKGIAFLWHMVRCIMAILFLVGERNESPDIILKLLDVNTIQAKPQYMMADELPLVLHECGYDNLNMNWEPKILWDLIIHYQSMLDYYLVAASRVKSAMEELKQYQIRSKDLSEFIDQLKSIRSSKTKESSQLKKQRLDHAKSELVSSSSSHLESGASDINVNDALITWSDSINIILSHNFQLSKDSSPYLPLLLVGSIYQIIKRCIHFF